MFNLKLKNSELIQEELNNLTKGLQTKFKVYKIIICLSFTPTILAKNP